MEKVPAELYEANSLDGANAWQRFRDVTLPCISPTTFFLLIVTMVNSLQAYDQIQILTQGGSSGSTRTLLYMYYQLGFEEYDMGTGNGCCNGTGGDHIDFVRGAVPGIEKVGVLLSKDVVKRK